MKKNRKNNRADVGPVEVTLDIIGGKWKCLILWLLREESLRFGQLQKKMASVSQRILTNQLRELEQHCVVHRQVFPVIPPKVVYSLTPRGESLIPVITAMCHWGKKHGCKIPEVSAGERAGKA